MDIEKIFSDLESNQTHECEQAKKKFVEMFSQSKEQWMVHYMMEYFFKTGSVRIIEVLVKVQSPHYNYIFDRLSEWLKTQTHRVQALNLFCFVVRKHPTWLYKVEKHRLFKDIIKLLLTENEIVPLMSALLSIITLLPIIPNLVPNFLNDLFHVFGRLASWNCQNPSKLSDDKLVHLQLGLQMLFHRLYGMYPCNFLAFISEFVKKEKGAIFHHTIKPLLETVRVHPLLVTATTETEVTHTRWKEMEPHDVVMECAILSLPVIHQDLNTETLGCQMTLLDLYDTPDGVRHTPGRLRHNRSAASGKQFSYQLKDLQSKIGYISRFDGSIGGSGTNTSIWSPHNEITASGPIPLTPTPSYMLTLPASGASGQLLGGTGSSPPEAAVEATPETTPMKDIKEVKHSPLLAAPTIANPRAVRAIFASSQPSSPMRREQNQFNYPDMSTEGCTVSTTLLEQELSARLVTRVTTTYERRLQQVIQDRTQTHSPFQTIESQALKLGYRSPIDVNLSKCDTPDIESDVSSHLTNSTGDHISKEYHECNETERSMCTAGGLHIPTSKSMQLLAKGIKRRNRMASYCYNDSSYDKMDKKEPGFVICSDSNKVRRTKSCSSICLATKYKLENGSGRADDEKCVNVKPQRECRLQKSGKMLSIAMAKKKTITSIDNASQTIEILPQIYENSLYEILVRSNEMRNTYESNLLYPQEILDEFMFRTITSKEMYDPNYRVDQEQYQLLCLQLLYERYRREIHAERNRRLMGRSRDKRSLEMERDRLREQVKTVLAENKDLATQIDKTKKTANERELKYTEELNVLKSKYQNECEQNKCLRQANEDLQARLNEELSNRKELNYELEALRGQVFNMNSELQHAQVQAEIGLQCKQELARLEAEFIIMGEVQVKCRDRLSEIDNYRLRDIELQMLQESYNYELKDIKHSLEERSTYLDSARHKIAEMQAQLVNNEKVITEQKRLLKAVKDEYEEKYKTLNKKYDVQKTIITQMEEKIMMSITKAQPAIAPHTCSPDTDKTDIASSMDRNSPLSTSLASSESLSASLRSTELKNLQQLVETPISEATNSINVVSAGANIIEGTRLPSLDLASSANTVTATSSLVSALNVVSTSGVTFEMREHNYDLTASTSSHMHPHFHLQYHQTKQQPPQHQKR